MATLQIAIALGSADITAVLPDRELVVQLDQPLRPGIEEPGPSLRQGFGRLESALRSALGDDRSGDPVRVHVVLLPPLSEARLVELPPLSPKETDAVLRRIAPRHFLGGGRGLVVGGRRFGTGAAARSAPVFATAASSTLVEVIHQVVASRGWRLGGIVPGQAAWLRALRQAAPLTLIGNGGNGQGKKRLVVAVEGDVVHLVRMAGELPDRVRRLPAGDPAAVLEAAGPEPGRVLLLAEGETHALLARSLTEAGWVLIPSEQPRSARLEAARYAADASPEFVPMPLARARRRRDRRNAVRMLVGAGLVLAAAAAVHLWGVGRAHRAVQEERAALREVVAPALALRDSLDRMMERIESLQEIGRATGRWTAFLLELSVLLPRDTYLVSLWGEGDRVVVEAAGGRAGDALSALREASTFRDVRLEGQIERDLEGGATSRERFTLSMILATGPGELGEGTGGAQGTARNGSGP
ncbi:hypothetical protein ACFL4Y_00725 [Gemmatimonadota bacterium]